MRLTISFIILFWIGGVSAQFTIKPVTIPGANRTSAETPPISLPFWDDFSASNGAPDTLLWKAGSDVFVNASLAVNAPTYGVVTFDGLTAFGAMHGADNGFNGPTDSLTSQIIDLGGLSTFEQQTVYLSFYWEGKGKGERPDEVDSLILQFLNDTLHWETVWKKSGSDIRSDTVFTQEIIQVIPPYLHADFRLRFQAFGRPSGPFDTWHIDYVYLNANRSATDTTHFDRALSDKATVAFSPYNQVPAGAFFRNPLTLSGQRFLSTNLDNQPNPLQLFTSVRNLTTGEDYGTFFNPKDAILPFEFRKVIGELSPGINIPVVENPLDSQVVEITHFLNTGDKNLFEEVIGSDTVFLPVDLKVNDTLRSQYLLHNYYAYDDGTAEYAAGLNEKNSKLAVKYVLFEQDTLTHIDIHFPAIVPEAAGKTVNVMVWSRLFPQEQLVQSIPHEIAANTELNKFQRIKLVKPILVTDTIYIGYQQLIQDYIPVGFDRSNELATERVFTKTNRDWVKNERLIGAFMIRPVFTPASGFILSIENSDSDVAPYPNPTNGIINFGKAFRKIEVYDLSGKLVQTGSGESINLAGKSPGTYVVRLISENQFFSKKIILSK